MKGKDWSLWSEWTAPLQFTIDQSFSPNITYSYDEVGNRLTKTEGSTTTNYQYNNMNQLTQMNEGGVITTFQYDNNGNLIQKSDGTDTWEYIYDDGCSCNNRLTEIKLNSQTIGRYFYDGDGKRIKKIEDSKNNNLHLLRNKSYI